jgi:metallo-beta-lactamase family protein
MLIPMKLTFWGAAGTVTGSMHQVHSGGQSYLLDCGLFQGRRKEAYERNRHFGFPPQSIDAVILSHAHIDHTGNLPNLVKEGFSGPVFSTPATLDLCRPMLSDSAYLQESDAEFLNRRRSRRRRFEEVEGDEVEPLYTREDADRTFPLFREVPLGRRHPLNPDLEYYGIEAGHMLGSTAVLLTEKSSGVRLCFSGDVGRNGLPIIRDPQPPPQVDYLILESTYGDRLHASEGPVKQKLADVINRTCQRGGRIIVPAFAVGRTQQLVLLLHELIQDHLIPSIPVFVDSPLAVNVTEVFRKHRELFDEETIEFLNNGDDPFGFSRLRYIRDVGDSKALNDLRGPYVVISASGMCEAGRILHHLKNNIENPRNTVLITGFQGENTLGRKLIDKEPEVNIFGEPYRLRAEVQKINELSGHADQRELLTWMRPMAKGLKKVFLVHGEDRQRQALRDAIQAEFGLEVLLPKRGESFLLS